MKTLKLKSYSDGGHGWLAIKRNLIPIDVFKKISPYSYQKGGTVYLEEDCDAGLVLEALRKTYNVEMTHKSSNKVSPIRSYDRFSYPKFENIFLVKVGF